MNGERRLPFFTAVNIDGSSVITINRDTGKVTKGPEGMDSEGEEGAEGGREKWYYDDRIDESEISEDKLYKDHPKMSKFHRGHLVKRTDPSWGTEDKAFKGQADTFHFTNCAPQHQKFNPITSRWAGVENWITKTSNDDDIRVSVFSGPVFSESDPKVDYLRIPKAFWKVIAWQEEGELKATAILADQSDLIKYLSRSEGMESFEELPDKLPEDYQVTIKEIERLTELSFGDLSDFDILSGAESMDDGRRKLKSFTDIKRR
jgi:endonuclease G, mitochondrial